MRRPVTAAPPAGPAPPRRTRRVARALNLASRARRLAWLGTRGHVALYRLTGGRLLGRWFGAPVMLIETVGRRTGRARTTPIIYMRDGDRLVVTPANAGADRTPDWWLNLREAGQGIAIVGGRRAPVRPRLLEGAEHDEAWRRAVEWFPALAAYRTYTTREFPLVVLEPDRSARREP